MGNWGDLGARAVSGITMAGVAIGCLVAGGRSWWMLLFFGTVGLAVEWGKLTTGAQDTPGTATLGVSVGTAFLASLLEWPVVAMLILGAGTIAALGWLRRPLLAAGVPAIGAAAMALVWLRADATAGLANVLFVLVVVWSSDIGAYMVGRALGGPKLAPAISPGKTISGAVGGLLTAAIAGSLVAFWAGPAGQSGAGWHAAALAVVFGTVAQAGDLAESWLKRRVGAKDSSHLIPGHGGLLDRLDALIAVAPVAALLALTLGRGVVLWA